ncbi:MAG TPA: manganese efflux pump [Mycobacteriales bacterium]|nr:manganese efflux pump [Mycobacteriales bacterium]
MFALLLVALALGLSNFGAALGIGLSGIDRRVRLKVAIVFAGLEVGMPIVGLLLGRDLAHPLGGATRWIGAVLLAVSGVYLLAEVLRNQPNRDLTLTGPSANRLAVIGVALSVDNLAIGFALGTHHLSLLLVAVLLGAISVGMSLIDLELGV